MKYSQLFTKTRALAPKDELSANAQLLIRGGFIDKVIAGVYTYLPLGLRVLNNIARIIREEVNAVGGQEVLMPTLHPVENYEKTGRQAIDVLFRTELKNGTKLLLGQSHEEIVVPLVQRYVESYKDLPVAVYQIQTKFRNELRAKSGIFRGREFLMKDLYSFHANEQDFEAYYETVKHAYVKIFARCGIGAHTYITHASGGTFSKYSHEFQTVTDAGEDTIYLCKKCAIAVNREIRADTPACLECGGTDAEEKKAIEVGNIFPLKTRFSDAFGLTYKNKEGKNEKVIMGCYGIGLGRLMGTVVEVSHDERGIIWPESVAPFTVHLLTAGKASESVIQEADRLYAVLQKNGVDVLYDDRALAPTGAKLADADLIGIPWRVVLSEKTMEKKGVEVKKRNQKEGTIMMFMEVVDSIKTIRTLKPPIKD
ncbi:prolyl-tRNA synthetase [Candidatus Uhrbacteria bacterium]|nr:prolyl-tRNA synthetase [Candidatus Uhrbacteria bacterium]